jgi:cytochrome c-type biogenesis protein CcmH/NrfG
MKTVDDGTALWVNALCQQRRPVLLLAAAMACHELSEHQVAITILGLCTKLEPDNPEAHLLLGKSLLALDRIEEAARALEFSITLEPEGDEAQSLLMWCYSTVA